MKDRADKLLYALNLCKSRTEAQTLISENKVYANGRPVLKPSEICSSDDEFTITDKPKFVSRGGLKLECALDDFQISVLGAVCVDIGASTGGFTDCLLQRGAKKVYAVEGGTDQLDKSLKEDERVVSIEKFNARDLTFNILGEYCDIAVMDVSFISQTLLHENVYSVLSDGGIFISLIKPQFEVGREHIKKGGIADSAAFGNVVNKVIASAEGTGFIFKSVITSCIKGGDGNTEFLAYFIKRSK